MSNPTPRDTTIQTGNAQLDSTESRGWLIGNFLPKNSGLRYSEAVELKWGTHRAGEARTDWVTGETRTTVGVLVSGEFEMEFRDRTVALSKPGDYVMWGPGVDHKWCATQDCVLLTVRWPAEV